MDQIAKKMNSLTQRLDHMVPDEKLTPSENQKAAAELASLSAKLYRLLPDQSLSPMERVERLARTVDERNPVLEHLQSAASKLQQLKLRLNELIPGDHTPEQKIDTMLSALDGKIGADHQHLTAIEKLEMLGDPRANIAPEKR